MTKIINVESGESSMKITTKLAVEYLKKNKRRTIGTVVAVILVSILITTLLTILSSYQSYRENLVRYKGNWEAEFLCIKYSDALEIEKDKNIKEISIWYDYGMSDENFCKNKTSVHRIHLLGYDENKIKNSGVYLKEGRMPENSNEIIIDKNTAVYYLNEEKRIGDKLEMTFEGETKEYTIVGIAEEIEEKTHNPNFSDGKDIRLGAITYLENNKLQEDKIVNTSVLVANKKKIYETASNLEQRLKLYEIPNIKKVTSVNRDELEEIDDGGLSDKINSVLSSMGVETGLTVEQQELEMPKEKVIYNEELLEVLGASSSNNTAFNTFIFIRNR